MPVMANPMTTALPSRAYSIRVELSRRVKAIHSAVSAAAIAITTEAANSAGS